MANGKIVSILLAAIAGTGIGYFVTQRYACPTPPASCNTYNLQLALNRLWSDHVIWTRQYIVSALADLPDAQAALARLMKNQEDLGNAIVPYYGDEAGKKLTALLKEHIAVAGQVVKAAKENQGEALKIANEKWHQNAADIATFLSSANPHWPKEALNDMLNEHLAVTTKEATLRLAKDWEADAANFDVIFTQALMMAHALADGIAKQFPNKF